jgi:hypothetical protein
MSLPCYSITDNTKIATQNAISNTRRALMQVPEVRQIVQETGEDAMKFIGINKKQAAYIAPVAGFAQGRITTKYIRGLRLRGKNWSVVPLLEWRTRRNEYRIECGFFYAF